MSRSIWGRLAATVAGAVLVSLLPAGWAPAAADEDKSGLLRVHTVPATPRARIAADGDIVTTGPLGRARLQIRNFTNLSDRLNVLDTRVTRDLKVSFDRMVGNPDYGHNGKPIVVGLNSERLISWEFIDRGGREVPVERITSLTLRSNTGEERTLKGADLVRPLWVASGRTQQTPKGLVTKELYWSVKSVIVDGAEVVNRGQQVFIPEQTRNWRISLLFYRVEVEGRDLLFGTLAGKGVEILRPDGEVMQADFDENGVALLDNLPRGSYDVRVYGDGVSFTRPMSISKDQTVEIEVITVFDMWLIAATIVLVALSLVAVGRRHRLRPLVRRAWRRVRPRRFVGAAAVVALATATLVVAPTEPAQAEDANRPPASRSVAELPPMYAYYYIWFQATSWQRAKTDYPLLGRYTSDDQVIMQRHVAMAKAAGLTGFMVSWKDQPHLSERLGKLVRVAGNNDFELGIIYQGLDFERKPLPVPQIAKDLRTFVDRYGDNPVFGRFGKPVVVITGTELFSVAELAEIKRDVADELHVLASAKSVEEYRRTASVMDGDAYYWSSANPRPQWHRERLQGIGDAVREDDGLWFAPASAGFDARLIGGRQVIPREGGTTLRAAIDSALSSDPDAVAIISWNEFSENSHIEPSDNYHAQELEVLAAMLGGTADLPTGLIPDTSAKGSSGLTGWGALLVIFLLVALLNLYLAVRRRNGDPPDGDAGATIPPPRPRGGTHRLEEPRPAQPARTPVTVRRTSA